MNYTLEDCRAIWADVAKKNDWYTEPFYVQVWIDPDTERIYDSVSHKDMTEDIIVYERED